MIITIIIIIIIIIVIMIMIIINNYSYLELLFHKKHKNLYKKIEKFFA